MSSLFDKLQNELDIREKQGGITALDLTELPTPLRKIMRTMLRKIELSEAEIAKLFEAIPEIERAEIKNLEAALKTLTKQGWLIAFGKGDNQRYKVNLRRKKGSTLAASIFDKLEERMEEAEKDKTEKPKSSTKDDLLGKLGD